MRNLIQTLWAAAAVAAALTPAFVPRDAGAQPIDILAHWMTGSFSSAVQAAGDTNYADIRLEMVRVWRDRTDGYWIYVEQASAENLETPYRQRVYHLTGPFDGPYTSEVYTIPDPLRFAGAWREKTPLAGLSADELILRDGCAVVLTRQDDGSFTGSTNGTGCESTLHGAAYATSEVMITYDRIVSWDRGFNEDGEQVWGAKDGGYVFLRTRFN